ncbi:hypothetical protein GCM10010919_33890 [Alishewanella longhuensis]|uniref:Uncharacterized protein n=1 Tax=Alishewanella longhuensis TaxID=1091037 RepID=A0ABQ3L2Q9_9ALTE|nr:hypothetical protein [Alishewanella longhuensis]GHG77932.1 hypothetical protein GCM10010919_33890 [Alishewanella longhuensis]
MKELSAKQWFWALLIVMPITFYLIELFTGEAQATLFSFISYIFSSVLGVLLGYVLFGKGLIKVKRFAGFQLLAFIIIMALGILLSLLINFVGMHHFSFFISKVVILSFSSSAIVLAFSFKPDENL